ADSKRSEVGDHLRKRCAIPSVRSRYHSRRVGDLVAESWRLAEQGVRELVIVSQDTMAYGADIGLRNGITTLLRDLAKIDGFHWIRFLYCYPNMVSEELVRLVTEGGRLCKCFDMPYQHASRSLVERMKRRGHG